MYQICESIGSGGFGNVYKAWHMSLCKYVVVKKIKSDGPILPNVRAEVDILKNLHHKYLPQVYDFVQIGTDIYSVMDFIEGYDLKKYIDAGYKFEEAQLVLWLRQLCEVLDYLHRHTPPIIHCDIKPANIMLTATGDICLIDFNISLDGMNNVSMIGLSNEYASPEQIRIAKMSSEGLTPLSEGLDPRTDIYSLGAVFYRLISGQMSSECRDGGKRLKDLDHPYSDAFANIIDKAMMTDPSRRFKSAGKLLESLDHMEKWGRTWRRLTVIGWIADGIALVVSMVCICLMIIGYKDMKIEQFFHAYETYMETARVIYSPMADDTELLAAREAGLTFINDGRWSGLWDKYVAEKANVLYCVGQASLGAGDYAQALTYMEKAAALNSDNPDIYRDIAIARAMVLDFEQARSCLEQARTFGLPEPEAALVEAQLAYMAGDDAQAYTLAVAAADGAAGELLQRAAVLAVEAADRLGNYGDCLVFTKQMTADARGPEAMLWLQKCGELCVKAVDAGSTKALDSGSTKSASADNANASDFASAKPADSTKPDSSYWLDEGIHAYDQLIEGGYAGRTDYDNLAYLYEKSDRIKACLDLLLTMEQLYPESYDVPMQLSYICYRMENDRPLAQRDYTKVMTYYKKANDLFQNSGKEISTDAGMAQLKNIIEQLRGKGWLE